MIAQKAKNNNPIKCNRRSKRMIDNLNNISNIWKSDNKIVKV